MPLAGVLVALAGCSSVEPKVGAPNRCVAVDGPTDDIAYYGSEYSAGWTPPSSSTGSGDDDDVCYVPAGGWCDDCESLNCCDTRAACYADLTCAGADEVLDQCLEGANASGVDGGVPACIAAFLTQGGAIAQARLDCQQACCPVACAQP